MGFVRQMQSRFVVLLSLISCLTLVLFVVAATARDADDQNGQEKSEGWSTHSHDVQHTGISSVPSQPLDHIR
jgi:hypothetical protein